MMSHFDPVPAITLTGEVTPSPQLSPQVSPSILRLGDLQAANVPMPSFLLKKLQASRTASGNMSPDSSTNLPSNASTNASFGDCSQCSDMSEMVNVVPDYQMTPPQREAKQWKSSSPAVNYSAPPPRFSPARTRHNPYQTQQQRAKWYYPEARDPHALALSQWQQQLEMKQQRAPQTADFGFGISPDQERNRALAENRRLPPAELKKLRKFFDNRNEHSHPTSLSST